MSTGKRRGAHEIRICLGSSCFARGNRDLVQRIQEFLEKNHLEDKVTLKGAHCLDACSEGPRIIINGKAINSSDQEDIMDKLEQLFQTHAE